MDETMVTGRMSETKKAQGGRILRREGLNASRAINLLYDRIIAEGNADFLTGGKPSDDAAAWNTAALFVDLLSEERTTRFDDMSKAEIRTERLRARGLM